MSVEYTVTQNKETREVEIQGPSVNVCLHVQLPILSDHILKVISHALREAYSAGARDKLNEVKQALELP